MPARMLRTSAPRFKKDDNSDDLKNKLKKQQEEKKEPEPKPIPPRPGKKGDSSTQEPFFTMPQDQDSGIPIRSSDRFLPIQLQFRPVFPGMATHFTTKDPKMIKTITKLVESGQWDSQVVAVLGRSKTASTTQLVTNVDDVHTVGCVCRLSSTLTQHNPNEAKASGETGHTMYVTLFPLFRVRVGELVETVRGAPIGEQTTSNPIDSVGVQCMTNVTPLPNEPYAVSDPEIQENCHRIIEKLGSMSRMSTAIKFELDRFSKLVPSSPGDEFKRPDFLADFAASLMPKNEGLQDILELLNVKERTHQIADFVGRELEYMKVQEGIYKYGNDQTQLRNREMILHEYLRYIRKELGMDNDEKAKLMESFQKRADNLEMPKDVRRMYDDELNKLRSLEPNAGEFATVRSYLDWLTSLQWGKYTQDKFSIKSANSLLDKSHYGLQDVKDRILEFLAISKLKGSVDGKIICLVGPPGVGKTSIARTIADSLGRSFDRFSVGGVHDVSEIKGHRRTYVAALPGRIIQALKKCGTMNPVILIDEIDKLARNHAHGDPSAALLEVLDPEQNKNFQDTYMEVPVDLSRVLFVCTANTLDTIPEPLLDRMEVMNIPGYLPSEKVEIARHYLFPKAMKSSGLESAKVDITPEALSRLVARYTRESGVRNLNKQTEKILRKLAYRFVKKHESNSLPKDDEHEKIADELVEQIVETIGPDDLIQYVGVPTHTRDRLFEELSPGVSLGLGWTATGGVPLYVESGLQETLKRTGVPKLTRTGLLGEVMNESGSIAYSFSRMFMTKRFPRNRFLDHAVIHTHFPEGAIRKDGPSAGLAMAASLVSLAMNVAPKDVAMTGELTLTGKVLQIGGLREKIVAAKTIGASVVIFPVDNKAEWEELPSHVKENMTPRPVNTFDEAFEILFGDVDAAAVNSAWPQLADPESPESSKSSQANISPRLA